LPYIDLEERRMYQVDIRQGEVWIMEDGATLNECFERLLAKVNGKESIRASGIVVCDTYTNN